MVALTAAGKAIRADTKGKRRMILDEGPAKIYKIESKNVSGAMKSTLVFLCEAFYGEIGVGMAEHYEAAAHGKSLLGRIRIWQDKQVRSGQVIVFQDGEQREIERVTHGTDDSARYNSTRKGSLLPITDIVLKPASKVYAIPAEV